MILVTGATGAVGRAVVDGLRLSDTQVRALSRNPAEAGLPDDVEVVAGDLTDADSLSGAFKGVRAAYLIPGPDAAAGAARAAAEAGVAHVVLLSSQSVHLRPENLVAAKHIAAERAVEQAGVPATFVRPGSFTANAAQWAGTIRADGAVYTAYPDRPAAPIDPADVGAVAAQALLNPGEYDKVLPVCGPEWITEREQVAVLAELLGRQLRVEAVAEADMEEAMAAQLGAAVAHDLLEVMRHGDGVDAGPLPTVEEVTGRAPRSFRDWAVEHLSLFSDPH